MSFTPAGDYGKVTGTAIRRVAPARARDCIGSRSREAKSRLAWRPRRRPAHAAHVASPCPLRRPGSRRCRPGDYHVLAEGVHPATPLCRDRFAYCTFATAPAPPAWRPRSSPRRGPRHPAPLAWASLVLPGFSFTLVYPALFCSVPASLDVLSAHVYDDNAVPTSALWRSGAEEPPSAAPENPASFPGGPSSGLSRSPRPWGYA